MNEDAPFHHFTLRHQVTAWISHSFFRSVVYTSRHGLTKGLRRKGGLGWLPERLSRSVETKEHEFWSSRDFTGKVVYDVGSFQGLLALFFARTARQVVCYEPNDQNRRRLLENIALNDMCNIQVRPVGIGDEPGAATMYFSPLMSGGASIDKTVVGTLQKRSAAAQQIRITTIDAEVAAGAPPPGFLKIDIEGHELAALRGARNTLREYRPELFLEMHGETIREKKQKVQAITEFLGAAGYDIVHVETGMKTAPDNCVLAMEGHLHAIGRPRP